MSEQSRTPAINDEGTQQVDTSYSITSLEIALLHGLFWCPARRVCEIADGLERLDFADDDHYEIFGLIVANARAVVKQSPEECLNPELVRAELRDAGKFTESMSHKMLAVASTGRPSVNPVELGEIVKKLRLERTRRGMRCAADGLHAAAANGSTADMAKAIDDTKYLAVLADRAGLNTSLFKSLIRLRGWHK
ncbi:hypothetical protein [Corynebacterium sp.]|uniref:hypothetical protein n=1 Tax=Corynebacterium sp. TaxID=1720 RepID=UPI0027BA6E89|nr:hypothetical protein [Corynebacterium sp.]